jgi:hypothetical protein
MEEVLVGRQSFVMTNADVVSRFIVALGAGYAFCRDNPTAAGSSAVVKGSDKFDQVWSGIGVLAAESLGASVFADGKPFGTLDNALLLRTRALASKIVSGVVISQAAVENAFNTSYLVVAQAMATVSAIDLTTSGTVAVDRLLCYYPEPRNFGARCGLRPLIPAFVEKVYIFLYLLYKIKYKNV